VFEIYALSFGAVLLGLHAIRPVELRPVARIPRRAGQLGEGLRYIRSRPDLMVLLFVVFFVGTFGMNFQMTLALISKDVFHEGSSGFGLLSSLMAVGSLTGSLLAARRRVPTMRLTLVAGALFGVLELTTGLMPDFGMFAAVLILTGVAGLTFNTTANSGMQHGVAQTMRGRVMGIYMMVFLGGTPVGSPLIGWIGEHYGPRWTLLVGGVVSTAAALVGGYLMLLARRRRTDDGTLVGAEPELVLARG
jgi:MFS family permease